MLEEWKAAGVSERLLAEVGRWREKYPWMGGREIPVPRFRFVGKEIIEASLAALLAGEHLLLVGAKATGKNVLAENLAAAFGRPNWNISLHVGMDAAGLLGADTFRGGEVVFRKGPVYECAEQGGFCVLDEINMARSEALAVLHSVLDYRRFIDLPEGGRLHLHPATRFVATMNYGYAGTRELNEALASRFLVLHLPPLDEAKLNDLLMDEAPDLSRQGKKILIGVFLSLAEKCAQGEISSRAVDLRGLLAAIPLMRLGIAPLVALKMGMTNQCLEPEEREIAEDVLALFVAPDLRPESLWITHANSPHTKGR